MTARIPLVLVALPALLSGCMGGKNSVDDTGGPVDADGDGVFEESDCDDDNANIYPGAAELCDGLDNNCDGSVDEDTATDATTWYADADSDGYGDEDLSTTACDQPPGYVAEGGDCDDDDASLNPDTNWYTDSDGDGYGDPDSMEASCEQPTGTVADNSDCDDSAAGTNPGATEVCDDLDVDEDCDGGADDADPEGASDLGTWYSDADGDGYGDLNDSGTETCNPASGTVEDNSDCDDSSAVSYPGADELCDGLDNDCDTWTSDSGVVSYVDSNSTWTDISSTFNGSPNSPASVTLVDEGTYYFCEGTYFVNLSVKASASLIGNSGDSSTVILDGGQSDTVVDVDTPGIDVVIEGVTISSGDSANYEGLFGSYLAGGGVFCEGTGTTLALDDVHIKEGTADIGGGLHAAMGCLVSTVGSSLRDNTAVWGAGAFLDGADHDFYGTEFSGNLASSGGGGFYFLNSSATTAVTVNFEESLISDNEASFAGGGMVDDSVGSVDLVCTGSASTSSGFTDNYSSGASYGGLYAYSSGSYDWSITSNLCDFGTSASGDNDPDDVAVYDAAGAFYWPYMAGDDASFSCSSTDNQCGTAANYQLGGTASDYPYGGYLWANVIEADSDATLNSFTAKLTLAQGCDVDFYLLSNSSYDSSAYLDTETWDVDWSQLAANSTYGTDLYSTEDIGLILESGTYYALAYATDCDSSDSTSYYDTSLSSADVGAGQTLGYLVDDAYQASGYTVGGTIDLTAYGDSILVAPFRMISNVTEL